MLKSDLDKRVLWLVRNRELFKRADKAYKRGALRDVHLHALAKKMRKAGLYDRDQTTSDIVRSFEIVFHWARMWLDWVEYKGLPQSN